MYRLACGQLLIDDIITLKPLKGFSALKRNAPPTRAKYLTADMLYSLKQKVYILIDPSVCHSNASVKSILYGVSSKISQVI